MDGFGHVLTNPDDHRQVRGKARSEYSSNLEEGSSVKDGSPSPPALTDGASLSDTPNSVDPRPLLSPYLSESNHRLSHVAETGQLQPRVRMPRRGDENLMPFKSTSTFVFPHDPHFRPGSLFQSSSNTSTPTRSVFGEAAIHAPQPLHAQRRTEFEFHQLPTERRSFDRKPSISHMRTSSGSMLAAENKQSTMLDQYLAEQYTESRAVVREREFTHGHVVRQSDVVSIAPTTVSAPDRIAHGNDYRRVNVSFEVGRSNIGSLAIPLELPTLPREKSESVLKQEKRQSRKLQKRRHRSKSLGG